MMIYPTTVTMETQMMMNQWPAVPPPLTGTEGMGILREFTELCGILLNFAQSRIPILIDHFLSFPQNFEFLFF